MIYTNKKYFLLEVILGLKAFLKHATCGFLGTKQYIKVIIEILLKIK